MDGVPHTAPFRDARYAPCALEVERRADGVLVLSNPRRFARRFRTAFQPLEQWGETAASRTWLSERSGEGRRSLSYGEGRAAAKALAGALLGAGVRPGDALLILARNGVDHALVTYAAMGVGVVAAPVSPQYGLPGADFGRLTHAAALLKPRVVYVDDADLFGEALQLPALEGLPVIASRNARPGDLPFEQLLQTAPAGAAAFAAVRPEQPAKYLLTSGSTGRPKAVVVTHANLALNSAQIEACFDDPEPPETVNAAPWSHSLGANALLHMVLHRGGTFHVDRGQPTAERFGETLSTLREISPTYHNMVPAGWALLADALERDEALARRFFARLRVMQYGGSGMPQALADRVQAVAVRLTGERITFAAGFGATETGPTACNVHWLNQRTGLIGLPVPGTSVKLVPAGPKLELRVRGPQVSPGYLDAPELSAAAFDEEGYYRLGDAVRLADPDRPEAGLVFDGRLTEDFKLSSGTFVSAGALRVAAISAIGGAAVDAVVCGEGEDGVGLLLFLNPSFCQGMSRAAVRAAVTGGLERFNAGARGGSGRVARAQILDGAPDPASGEITDKGYINQALARTLRAAAVARLFAEPPDEDVMRFDR